MRRDSFPTLPQGRVKPLSVKKWAKTSAKADNMREERINADLMSQQRGTKTCQGPKAALHQTLLFKHLTQQWRGEAGDDDDLRFNDSITVLGD